METTYLPEQYTSEAGTGYGEPSGGCYYQGIKCDEVAFAALHTLAMVFVLINNTLVLMLIFRNRHLRLPGNYHVVSLCFANLAAGVLGVPSLIISHLGLDGQGTFCKVYQYFIHLVDMAEVWSLVAIAMDRCRVMISINHTKKTPGRAISEAVTIWVFSCVYAIRSPFLFDQILLHHGDVEHTESVCAPLDQQHGETLGLLSDIFLVVDFMLLFIIPVFVITILYLIIVVKSKQNPDLNIKGKFRRLHVFGVATLLVAIFVVCTLPLFALELYVNVGPGPFDDEPLLINLFELFTFINFGLNPIVYALTRENFRKALQKMCGISNAVSPTDEKRTAANVVTGGTTPSD